MTGAVRLLFWYWPGSVFESATSGTWAALAWDFAHGELYRPVLSDTGYGGTRYMPMLIVTYGLLLRAHVDPVVAGVLLMQASVLAACAALYVTLRSASVARATSAAFALTPYATVIYQKYCTDVRADYLAAALVMFAVAGLSAGVRQRANGWIALSAVACVFAGLTKLTAFAFVVPLAGWLLTACDRRTAMRFLVGSSVAFTLALVAVEVISGGRFLDNLRSAITAGMVASDIWRVGVPSLLEEIATDPFIAAPFALACWCGYVLWRDRLGALFVGYLATAAVVTAFILSSPGTTSNHMVDLQLASTLVIGIGVVHRAVPARVMTAVYLALATMMGALSWPLPHIPSVIATLAERGPHHRATIRAMHAEFLSGPGVYLSSDPLVPILNGERPIALDSFFLDVSIRRGTAAGLDLARRIGNRDFDTIVLRDANVFSHDMNAGDPDLSKAAETFFAKGGTLTTLVHSAYEIRAIRKPFVILRPRDSEWMRLAAASLAR
jgi:hypothetical protein